MRIISWNVNGRVKEACQRQLDCVLAEAPDVLALQEVTVTSYGVWWRGLLAAGYSVASTVDLVRLPYPEVEPPVRRKYFNLTASRGGMATLPGLAFSDPERARLAFPEKYLVTQVVLDGSAVDVHNAHLPPGSSRGEIKVHAFRAIRQRVDEPTNAARILCGDLNTPQAEDHESVTTWASAHPRLRDEWDAAERGVLEHPTMRDVYRERHPSYAPYPASHLTRGIPRRYDHVYASPEIATVWCRYLGAWLEARLSDHAPVEAELVLST
jgi:exonuclease III